MTTSVATIIPTLFCGGTAKEQAEYYVSIFPNSKIEKTTFYPASAEITRHGYKEGDILAITFSLLNGSLRMTAINGPPNMFKFNEAVSFTISTKDQEDTDHYWDNLTKDADQEKQFCCWCQDKFGLWWQVVPKEYHEIIEGENRELAAKTFKISMNWKKADIAGLSKALEEVKD